VEKLGERGTVPVDLRGAAVSVLSVTAKREDELDESSPQKTNRQNTPLWVVETLIDYSNQETKSMKVTVAAPIAPNLTKYAQIHFEGLEVGPWASGKKRGLYWVATSVQPVKSGAQEA